MQKPGSYAGEANGVRSCGGPATEPTEQIALSKACPGISESHSTPHMIDSISGGVNNVKNAITRRLFCVDDVGYLNEIGICLTSHLAKVTEVKYKLSAV